MIWNWAGSEYEKGQLTNLGLYNHFSSDPRLLIDKNQDCYFYITQVKSYSGQPLRNQDRKCFTQPRFPQRKICQVALCAIVIESYASCA